MKKLLALLTASVLLITAMAGCAAAKGNTVLATSGNENFFVSDYLYFYSVKKLEVENEILSSGEYTTDNIADYWTLESGDLTNEQYLQTYSIDETKQYATLLSLAKSAGFSINSDDQKTSDQAVDEAVKNLASGGQNGEREFQKMYGASSANVKSIYANFSLINQYTDSIANAIQIPDEEVQAYYDEIKADLKEVTVRHILLDTREKSDEEKEELKALAQDLLEQVNAGVDIGELAGEYSDDEGSSSNNGEYTFGRGQMVEEFEDFAFNSNDGDTGIVETMYGYHIMKLMFSSTPTLDQVSEELKSYLLDGQAQEKIYEAYENSGMDWQVDEKVLANAHK